MKINLILSSEEIEQLITTHIMNSGFDTANKELDIDFKFDGEDITAVVTVEDLAFGLSEPKVKRTRRTKEQMEADTQGGLQTFSKDLFVESDNTKFMVTDKLVEDPADESLEDTDTYEEEAPFALTNPSELIGSSDVVEEPAKTKGIFD